MKQVRHAYFRGKCRYEIVPPEKLVPGFVAVFNFYFHLQDPEREGCKFYKRTAKKDFLRRMSYICMGKWSHLHDSQHTHTHTQRETHERVREN